MTDVVIRDLVGKISLATGFSVLETNLPPRFFWLNRYVLPLWILGGALLCKFRGTGVIVGSFSNSSIISCLLAALVHRKNSIFFLNHNISTDSPRLDLLFSLLVRWSGKVVALEVDPRRAESLERFGGRLVSVLHPLPSVRVAMEKPGDVIYIGFVGRIRPEKRISKTIDIINKLERYLVERHGVVAKKIAGCPRSDWAQISLGGDWEWWDTTGYDQYEACLSKLGILVSTYDVEKYNNRPSGVVAEAVSHGVFTISTASNSIRNQLTFPSPVGFPIQDVDRVTEADLEEMFMLYRQARSGCYEAHATVRGIDSVAKVILEG